MNTQSVWVLTSKLSAFSKEVAKLTRKAQKIGCDLPSITITDEVKFEKSYSTAKRLTTFSVNSFTKVIVQGEAPVLTDWTVVAEIQHKKTTAGYENIVSSALHTEHQHGKFGDVDSVSLQPACEHCNIKRVRKTTYLLQHNLSKEIVQIGSTCIDDFVRSASMAQIKVYFSYASFIENAIHAGAKEHEYEYAAMDLSTFTQLCGLVISEKGFVSKSTAEHEGLQSTASIIMSVLHDDVVQNKTPFTPEAIAAFDAKDIYDYLTVTLKNQEINNFTLNVLNAIKGDLVNIENRYTMAVLIGAIGHYINKREKDKNKIEFKKETVGLVGGRLTFTLTLLAEYVSETNFGYKTTYIFKDDLERRFKWVNWSAPRSDMIIGHRYNIKGTISNHETDKIPTTVINRCKDITKVD